MIMRESLPKIEKSNNSINCETDGVIRKQSQLEVEKNLQKKKFILKTDGDFAILPFPKEKSPAIL